MALSNDVPTDELVRSFVIDHDIGLHRQHLVADDRRNVVRVDAFASGIDDFDPHTGVALAEPQIEPETDELPDTRTDRHDLLTVVEAPTNAKRIVRAGF